VKARNSANKEIRGAVREYEKEIARLAKKNPKVFYRHVNGRLKTRPGGGDLKTDNGEEAIGAQLKSNLFSQYFSSVYTEEDLHDVPDLASREGDKLSSIEFTEEDVNKLLNKLVPDESPAWSGQYSPKST
jgi:hypothetical protein